MYTCVTLVTYLRQTWIQTYCYVMYVNESIFRRLYHSYKLFSVDFTEH